MKHLSLVLLTAVLCAAQTPAPLNTLSKEEKKEGWKLLFDGKTMKGWIDPASKNPPSGAWTIEDGCLKAKAKPRIHEDLVSRETFRDFELMFDWKISPRGNSGLKYRIQKFVLVPEKPKDKRFEDTVEESLRNAPPPREKAVQEYVIGFEYQVIDNDGHADARRGPKYQAGALYDMIPPVSAAQKPVGEFNHSKLVIKGDHIEHWLNGVKVVDGDLNDPAIKQSSSKRWGDSSPVYELLTRHAKTDCPISLQNHGDDAWFRNIKIRKL